MTKKISLLLMICLIGVTACGGRMPEPKRARSVMSHHFNRYGKKFPASEFGHTQVQEIDILGTEEIHKNLVQSEAFVTLQNGNVFKVRFTLEKKALGWRAVSWENLSGQTGTKAEPSPPSSAQ